MKPQGTVLRAGEWTVTDAEPAVARRMIERWHYSRGYSNTYTALHALVEKSSGLTFGVAWWIPPTRRAARATYRVPESVLSLSRLVLAPGAPKNSASFLVARSSSLIRPSWRCLVTYADTCFGHTGAIYRACNWEYLGLTEPEGVYVLDGKMVARKAGPVTRTHAEMLSMGCEYLGRFPKHKYRLVRS